MPTLKASSKVENVEIARVDASVYALAGRMGRLTAHGGSDYTALVLFVGPGTRDRYAVGVVCSCPQHLWPR